MKPESMNAKSALRLLVACYFIFAPRMKSKPWKMEMDLSGSLLIDGCDLVKRIREMKLDDVGLEMSLNRTPSLICISGLLNPQRDITIHTPNLLIHV